MPRVKTEKTTKKKAVVKEKKIINKVSKAKKPAKAKVAQRLAAKAKKPAQAAKPKPILKIERLPIQEVKEQAVERPKPIKEPQAPVPVAVEEKPKPETRAPVIELKELELKLPITIKDLSVRLQQKSSVIIQGLMKMGVMAGINQSLAEEVVAKICSNYGYKLKHALDEEEAALIVHQQTDRPEDLQPRSPVVTLMGHVDHGKTSLLDAIRKSKVVEKEHGGITQHIGAYRVILPGGVITFLDTPGHEAFTAMRARGASITDMVILVVAADDGIMPQTQEAIDHARAAGVPIIVAVNKIDKPQADLDKVKKQLTKFELTAEGWGGKTIVVPVSAKTGQGIDNLLEMIILESQMLELKCNPDRSARGVVIEAKMSKGRGPVVTLLIQNGTLHLNQNIIVGNFYGKIRAMFDDRGHSVTDAPPSFPVEVLGVSGIPQAGDKFFMIEEEKQAKDLAAARAEKDKQQQMKQVARISLEDLHAQIAAGKIKELKIIIKADVQGSLEAIEDTLNKLNVSEIKLDIIHKGVGSVNSSDVILAVASNALILGFNVGVDENSKEQVAKEGIDVRSYNIIYELANDIKAAVEGMLEPKLKKTLLGKVEVRKVFKLSRSGIVAGCFVTKGKINRSCVVSLVRNGQAVFEGKLSSLKRFKDDVREVTEDFECGITLAGFEDLQQGDIIEAYEVEKIARKL